VLAGALTRLVAVLLMQGIGRIAGASGIFAGLMTLNFEDALIWPAIFVLDMLVGGSRCRLSVHWRSAHCLQGQ